MYIRKNGFREWPAEQWSALFKKFLSLLRFICDQSRLGVKAVLSQLLREALKTFLFGICTP
jgi:hypothetical protein